MNTRPNQKFGTDAKNSDSTVKKLSPMERGFSEESSPNGMPMAAATATAKMATVSVVGNLGSRISNTGFWL